MAAAIAVVLLAWAAVGAYQQVSRHFALRNGPIYFVPKSISSEVEFWQVMNQGVFAAAKEYNADVKVIGTQDEADVDGQIRLLEEAIKRKPKAIILAANDYNRLVPVARQIIGSGAKLLTVDSDLDGSLSSSFVATDNVEAGRKAGEAMRSWVGTKANLVIVSVVKGSGTAIDREKGVRESLARYPDIHLSETYFSEGSVRKAYDIVTRLLRDDPSIDGIIGLNEPTVTGAADAIRALGVASKVKLVGFDSSMNEVADLEDGVLQATVVQKPFNMGYLAVKAALDVYNGKKTERRIDTGSEVITKDTMYSSENQKLLFPFEEK